eukprot:258744_1
MIYLHLFNQNMWSHTPLINYIDCSQRNDNHDMKDCNIVKRICHLLSYYQHYKRNVAKANFCEYISYLKNYDIPTMMEDWHQCKNNHLRTQEGINNIQNMMHINCENTNTCVCMRRYRRHREQIDVSFDNIDANYKNIILTDELDSMHAFVFHSITTNDYNNYNDEKYDNDDYETSNELIATNDESKDIVLDMQAEMDEKDIWFNKPQTTIDCNVEQIIYIVQQVILNNLVKLHEWLPDIVRYIKKNQIDGEKLYTINRKDFMTNIAKDLNNNKLRSPLGALRKQVMEYDLSQFNKGVETEEKDIWFNKPQNLNDCTVEQIVYMTESIISEKLDKLQERKNDIIIYIKENQMDGGKLHQINRKEFMTNIATYLNNKKLTMALGKLLRHIREYNLSQFKQDTEQKQHVKDVEQNNKFVTEVHENKRKTEETHDHDNELSIHIVFWRDLFDNIHCYLCHIYDFGYRSKTDSMENVFDNDEHTKHYVDKKFKSMQMAIMKKTKMLKKIKGFNRVSGNKYNIHLDDIQTNKTNFSFTWTDGLFRCMEDNGVSQLSLQKLYHLLNQEDFDTDSILYEHENKDDCNNINGINHELVQQYINKNKLTGESFSIGLIFYYWPYYTQLKETIENNTEFWNINNHSGYKKQELFVPKKYQNLKNELFNNTIHPITYETWKIALKKAYVFNETEAVKNTKCLEDGDPLHYNITNDSTLEMRHLLSLIFYCDKTELCT